MVLVRLSSHLSILRRSPERVRSRRWADVPVKQSSALYVAASGCAHGSPTVKYRGIFLNDEQPALQNWAMEKFSNGTGAYYTGSPFNSMFYTKLYVQDRIDPMGSDGTHFLDRFELMLRFKANYLWPGEHVCVCRVGER